MRRSGGCLRFILVIGLTLVMYGLLFDGRLNVPILWVRDRLAEGIPAGCAWLLWGEEEEPSEVVYDAADEPVEPALAAEGDAGLWYEALNETQRRIYGPLLESLRLRQERFVLAGCTSADVEAAFWAIRGDHPEIFWLGGFSYSESNGSVTVLPEFLMGADEIDAARAQIDQTVGEVLAGLPPDASSYDKLRYFYEWIVNNTDYVFGEHDQVIQGVFVDHAAVCAGYARALQYLLATQGIRCDYVTGRASGHGSHGWCIVWLDGTPTYVDVTWADPTFLGDDGSILPGDLILYDYLCITTAEISRDHVATEPAIELPRCDSTAYDYYRLQGTYLDDFSALGLRDLIVAAEARGETSLRIKLGSREEYEEALSFVSSQEVFRCFDERIEELAYVSQETLYIIGLDWNPIE